MGGNFYTDLATLPQLVRWPSAGDTAGYTYGDSDVISMPAGFRRHLVGKTLINVFTVISLKYALSAVYSTVDSGLTCI